MTKPAHRVDRGDHCSDCGASGKKLALVPDTPCRAQPTFYGGRRIRGYSDNILVQLDEHRDAREDRSTAGGIIIPRTADASDAWATVIACGPGAFDEPIDHAKDKQVTSRKYVPMDPAVVPGARVALVSKHQGDRVYDDERNEYRMVRQGDILGVEE